MHSPEWASTVGMTLLESIDSSINDPGKAAKLDRVSLHFILNMMLPAAAQIKIVPQVGYEDSFCPITENQLVSCLLLTSSNNDPRLQKILREAFGATKDAQQNTQDEVGRLSFFLFLNGDNTSYRRGSNVLWAKDDWTSSTTEGRPTPCALQRKALKDRVFFDLGVDEPIAALVESLGEMSASDSQYKDAKSRAKDQIRQEIHSAETYEQRNQQLPAKEKRYKYVLSGDLSSDGKDLRVMAYKLTEKKSHRQPTKATTTPSDPAPMATPSTALLPFASQVEWLSMSLSDTSRIDAELGLQHPLEAATPIIPLSTHPMSTTASTSSDIRPTASSGQRPAQSAPGPMDPFAMATAIDSASLDMDWSASLGPDAPSRVQQHSTATALSSSERSQHPSQGPSTLPLQPYTPISTSQLANPQEQSAADSSPAAQSLTGAFPWSTAPNIKGWPYIIDRFDSQQKIDELHQHSGGSHPGTRAICIDLGCASTATAVLAHSDYPQDNFNLSVPRGPRDVIDKRYRKEQSEEKVKAGIPEIEARLVPLKPVEVKEGQFTMNGIAAHGMALLEHICSDAKESPLLRDFYGGETFKKNKYDYRQAIRHDLDKATTAVLKMRHLVPDRHPSEANLERIQNELQFVNPSKWHIDPDAKIGAISKSLFKQGFLDLKDVSLDDRQVFLSSPLIIGIGDGDFRKWGGQNRGAGKFLRNLIRQAGVTSFADHHQRTYIHMHQTNNCHCQL